MAKVAAKVYGDALFELAVELKEKTGCHIKFINLSGGVGIPYRPSWRWKRTAVTSFWKRFVP